MTFHSQYFTIKMVIIMDSNFSCGNRIKELRKARALSQETLALNAGITTTYLGLVERGKKNATVATIEAICYALNISLADFFSVADSPISVEDDTGIQILHQLTGLSDNEKQLILQIIKNVVQLRHLGIHRKS